MSCPARRTAPGSRHRGGETRSTFSKSRRGRVCRSSAQSGTGACCRLRSPSSGAAPTSWLPTSLMEPRTGLHAQLCGDAHLSNFGIFASPDRRLVFSLNDFDETLPGPFEWDVKRLAASLAVAGRDRGFDEAAAPLRGDGGRARVPRGNGAVRTDADDRRLVHASRRRGHPAAAQGRPVRQAAEARSLQRRGRADEGQHARSLEAVPHGRRRAPDRRRSSLRHADRGRAPRRGAAPPRRRRTSHDPHLPAHAAARSPASARELPLRPRRPQGRRRRQRRSPNVDPAHGRP